MTSSVPPCVYPFSLHDALPISLPVGGLIDQMVGIGCVVRVDVLSDDDAVRPGHAMEAAEYAHCSRAIAQQAKAVAQDRKSTRLNSSHLVTSYAVFYFKKQNQK